MTLRPDLVAAILRATIKGFLTDKVDDHIVARAEVLLQGFARVGIIALVDEATGYQTSREVDALQQYLRRLLSDRRLLDGVDFEDCACYLGVTTVQTRAYEILERQARDLVLPLPVLQGGIGAFALEPTDRPHADKGPGAGRARGRAGRGGGGLGPPARCLPIPGGHPRGDGRRRGRMPDV